jgi:hypothetical protein
MLQTGQPWMSGEGHEATADQLIHWTVAKRPRAALHCPEMPSGLRSFE